MIHKTLHMVPQPERLLVRDRCPRRLQNPPHRILRLQLDTRLLGFHGELKANSMPKNHFLFYAFAGLKPAKAHFFPPKQR